MYCRKCGREIPDDSVMCGYCGTPTNPDNPYTYGGTPQNMDEGANGLGIASMILGIVAILLACCAGGKWLTFLVAAAGLILGIIALQKPKYGSSRGMALAGVICSVIALLNENYCDHFTGGGNRNLSLFPYVSLLKSHSDRWELFII